MRIIVLAAALVAACAPVKSGSPDAARAEDAGAPYGALPPPTPEGVARIVRAQDAGAVTEIGVGETLAVELVGVPTAGYVWTPVVVPAFLAPAGDYGGPTSRAQLEPGFAGGSHWEAFLFEATAAGEGVLRFEQRRPWDSDEPPADEFAVTVRAAAPTSE